MTNCLQCNSEFETRPRKKFCSKKCGDKFLGTQNKAKKAEYDRLRHAADPLKKVNQTKEWRKNNPGKRWEMEKKSLEKSGQKRFYKSALTVMRAYLKSGKPSDKSKVFATLGYSSMELKLRLISTMPDNYSWEDFLNGKLHIDHVRPHSKFKYVSFYDKDFIECWSLNNLQLLTANDNNKKHAKYEH